MKFYKNSDEKEPRTVDIDTGIVLFFVNKASLDVNALNIARYVTADNAAVLEYKEFKNVDVGESIVYTGDNVTKCEPLLYKSSGDDDEVPDAFRCTAELDGDELTFIIHVMNGAAIAFDVETMENKEAFDRYLDKHPNKHLRIACTHGTHVVKPDDYELEGDTTLGLACFINIEVFTVDDPS